MDLAVVNAFLDRAVPSHVQTVMAADPGRGVMATYAHTGAPGGRPTTGRITLGEYSTLSGMGTAARTRTRWRARWLEKAPEDLAERVRGAAARPLAVMGADAFLANYADHARVAGDMATFLSDQRHLNLKLKVFIYKRVALNTLAMRMASPDLGNILLGWGGAKFYKSSAGMLMRAVEALPHVTLLKVDEFCTSKLCSRCKLEMEHVKGPTRVVVRHADGGVAWAAAAEGEVHADGRPVVYAAVIRPIYGLKLCRVCSTTWQRDVNAAINILGVFLSLVVHGRRPEEYTRAFRRALAQQDPVAAEITRRDRAAAAAARLGR